MPIIEYYKPVMNDKTCKEIAKRFKKYVDTYRNNGLYLHPMLQLKLTHTMLVVENAKTIMQGERWNEEHVPTGETTAILHDIGRFSQFAEYGTFRDSESIDHAERGLDVIEKLNIFDGSSPETATRITEAIRWHNKKEVPEEAEKETAKLAHLIRDADKLDIFRVMETAIKDGSIENNPEITWGLDFRGAPNPKLVESVIRGVPVDYSLIQALSDFILIQVGWVISGFYYNTSLKIIKERNTIEFRRNFLKTLTNDSSIDQCCNAAEDVLKKYAG